MLPRVDLDRLSPADLKALVITLLEKIAGLEQIIAAKKGGRSGGNAGREDEIGQIGDGWRGGCIEAGAEVVPERQAEFPAGLHQAEKGVAAGAAGIGAGAGGDL